MPDGRFIQKHRIINQMHMVKNFVQRNFITLRQMDTSRRVHRKTFQMPMSISKNIKSIRTRLYQSRKCRKFFRASPLISGRTNEPQIRHSKDKQLFFWLSAPNKQIIPFLDHVTRIHYVTHRKFNGLNSFFLRESHFLGYSHLLTTTGKQLRSKQHSP